MDWTQAHICKSAWSRVGEANVVYDAQYLGGVNRASLSVNGRRVTGIERHDHPRAGVVIGNNAPTVIYLNMSQENPNHSSIHHRNSATQTQF